MFDQTQKEVKDVAEEMPFILNFLEERPGAMSLTTTGTYDNPDDADSD